MADSIGGPAKRIVRKLSGAGGGSALRVEIVSDAIRAREGGPALPVYYVQDSELAQNGGVYILKGNKPIPIYEDTSGEVGGHAVPVYVTNPANGDGEQAPLLELQADTGVTTSTASFAGTGVITQSGTTVSGVGTAFLSEVVVGDRIQAIGIDGIVQSIATNTSLALDTSATVGVGVVYTVMPQAGTARVTTWLDQSGGGHHFTQSGTARPSLQTIGGYPAVVFDGANDWMLGPDFADNLSSWTTFVVVRALPSLGYNIVISKINNDEETGWEIVGSANQLYISQDIDNSISIQAPGGSPVVRSVMTLEKISTSVLHAYKNGDNVGENLNESGTASNSSNTELVKIAIFDDGSVSGFSHVELNAILIYSPALSASDRAAKEQELADRYGITL